MNKLTCLILLIAVIAISTSCTKESKMPVVFSSEQSGASQRYFIGEHFGGGIIFYIDKTGKHGIIAATADFEEPASWSKKDTLNGAESAKLGAGITNSKRIYKTQGYPQNEGEDYAAIECMVVDINGYSDWYLPSKDELNEMYLQKNVIGGFMPFAYWSSTETDASHAWFENFSSGVQIKEPKLFSYAIRPVRYF